MNTSRPSRLSMLILTVSALCMLASCDDNPTTSVTSSSGVNKQVTQVATDSNGWTVEQKNVAERLKIDNAPGAIKHLYIISPYSGQTLIYCTVKGKVTSGGKRLTPTTIVAGGGGDFRQTGFDALGGKETTEVLQDDGTYGSSCEYIYWWDTAGKFHQHFFTGGQIIHVSEQPLSVKGVVINISGTQE